MKLLVDVTGVTYFVSRELYCVYKVHKLHFWYEVMATSQHQTIFFSYDEI